MDGPELQAALEALLAQYGDVLELAPLYGIQAHRPGSRAHDWFAGVRPRKGTAKLMLLPITAHPELLEGVSPGLLRRRTGEALFELRPGDEGLVQDVERLLALALQAYQRDA